MNQDWQQSWSLRSRWPNFFYPAFYIASWV